MRSKSLLNVHFWNWTVRYDDIRMVRSFRITDGQKDQVSWQHINKWLHLNNAQVVLHEITNNTSYRQKCVIKNITDDTNNYSMCNIQLIVPTSIWSKNSFLNLEGRYTHILSFFEIINYTNAVTKNYYYYLFRLLLVYREGFKLT